MALCSFLMALALAWGVAAPVGTAFADEAPAAEQPAEPTDQPADPAGQPEEQPAAPADQAAIFAADPAGAVELGADATVSDLLAYA